MVRESAKKVPPHIARPMAIKLEGGRGGWVFPLLTWSLVEELFLLPLYI